MLGTTFLVSSLVPASLLVTLNVLLILTLPQDFPSLAPLADYVKDNPTLVFWLAIASSVGLGFAFTALEDVVLGLFRGECFPWLLVPLRKRHRKKYRKWLKKIDRLKEKLATAKDEDFKKYYREQIDQCEIEFHKVYPERQDQVKPTALGNVFAALDCRILKRYRIGQAIIWPRLAQVIPMTYGRIVENTNTFMHFLLNISLVLAIFIFEMLGLLIFETLWGIPFRPYLLCWSIPCLLLAVASYRLALPTACTYCDYASGCFDLFRHDLLRQMDLPLPQDAQEEREIWDNLTNYLVTDDECYSPLRCYAYSRYGPRQEPTRSVVERILVCALTVVFLVKEIFRWGRSTPD
jgi:hypothetical protein